MTVLAWAALVFAATDEEQKRILKDERLFLLVGALVGVLLFGAWLIGRVDRWRKRQMEEEDDSPRQVGSFRSMYENGELSKEEYDRVMRRMAERVGAKPKPLASPAVPPAAEPPAMQEPPETPPA